MAKSNAGTKPKRSTCAGQTKAERALARSGKMIETNAKRALKLDQRITNMQKAAKKMLTEHAKLKKRAAEVIELDRKNRLKLEQVRAACAAKPKKVRAPKKPRRKSTSSKK